MANHNWIGETVDNTLPVLLKTLLEDGEDTGSRNGRTMELTHVGITLTEPWKREITLTHRKANIAAQIAETAWVLAGRDDVEFLSHYLPRARDFSDDGVTWRGAYGKRLRSWEGHFDQIDHVVELLRADPLSRRAVISIYDPVMDGKPGKDIPCNDFITFSSRLGYLDVHVTIRSNDAMWGWSGINAFEWSVLQEIVAGLLGIKIGKLHFSQTSFHLYEQHFDRACKIGEDRGYPRALTSPGFSIPAGSTVADFDDLLRTWFDIERRIRNRIPLLEDEVNNFPEPMLRSWLRVLQWWWSKGSTTFIDELQDTRLAYACMVGVQPKAAEPIARPEPVIPGTRSDFVKHVTKTHDEKHAAYGNSWMKRGEFLSILGNIARKVDRIGGSETTDETSADTAMDLFVYLSKYRIWLFDPFSSELENTSDTNSSMEKVDRNAKLAKAHDVPWLTAELKKKFEVLWKAAEEGNTTLKHDLVETMVLNSHALARFLWDEEQGAHAYRGADVD